MSQTEDSINELEEGSETSTLLSVSDPHAPKADWDAIKREFEAGQLTLVTIGKMHGVNHGTISRKAAKLGWVRGCLAGEVANAVRLGIITDESEDVDQAVEIAARRGIIIVQEHRKGLAKMRRISTLILDELQRILLDKAEGIEIETKEGGKVVIPFLGERESICDAFLKAANAMSKYVPLERQAFNLDAEIDPKTLTDDQILRLLSRNSVT